MKAVNLLPPDMRGASKATSERSVVTPDSNAFGAFAVLGGLALAVVGVAGVVLTGNAVKDREAQIAGVRAEHQQLARRTAALKPYADFEQMASERVETVRDLAGRRFDWEQAVRDLSRAIPGDVTLSKLTGNVSTDTGGSGSGLRSAINAPAITLTGCTTSQKGVARLMARLHSVDGVTRVSLSKSDKSDVQGGGAGVEVTSADPVASGEKAPCGVGRRPEFEMVMFFEGQADAASAPGAPSSGGSTPADTPASGGANGGASAKKAATTGAEQPASTPTPQEGDSQ
jgi:Tfp pilus assembly protein PilN